MFLYFIIFPSLFFYSFYVLDRLFDISFSENPWLSWINIPRFLEVSQGFATIIVGKLFELFYFIVYYLYALRIKIEGFIGHYRPREIEQIGNRSFVAKDYRIVANNIGIEGILEYVKDGKSFVAPIKKMDEVDGLIEALKEMETNKEDVVMVEFIFSDNSNMIVENMAHFNKLIGQDGAFLSNENHNDHFEYIDFILKLYEVIPNEKILQRVEVMKGDGDIKTFERKLISS
jgi:hypothetical protein